MVCWLSLTRALRIARGEAEVGASSCLLRKGTSVESWGFCVGVCGVVFGFWFGYLGGKGLGIFFWLT